MQVGRQPRASRPVCSDGKWRQAPSSRPLAAISRQPHTAQLTALSAPAGGRKRVTDESLMRRG